MSSSSVLDDAMVCIMPCYIRRLSDRCVMAGADVSKHAVDGLYQFCIALYWLIDLIFCSD